MWQVKCASCVKNNGDTRQLWLIIGIDVKDVSLYTAQIVVENYQKLDFLAQERVRGVGIQQNCFKSI
ncbi:MAG: hypothetical protein PVF58_01950 [Candidatus Methanofastidiosia archaeon]